MNNKITKLLSIVTAILPLASNGASIISATTDQGADLTGGTARAIYGQDNMPIAFGTGSISIGYFTATLDFSAVDGATIEAAFNKLGVTSSFNGFSGNPVDGLYDHIGSDSIISGGTNADFIGKNIVIVIGDELTIGNSNALLVLQSSTLFAADAPSFNASISLQSGAGLTVLHGSDSYDGSQTGSAVAPIFNFGGTDYYAANNSYQLGAVVPEPSALLLGAFGSLLVLRRRRE